MPSINIELPTTTYEFSTEVFKRVRPYYFDYSYILIVAHYKLDSLGHSHDWAAYIAICEIGTGELTGVRNAARFGIKLSHRDAVHYFGDLKCNICGEVLSYRE